MILMADNMIDGGGFADIYRGMWRGQPVAVKRFRIYLSDSDERRRDNENKSSQEVLIWRNLNHPRLLPLLGVEWETISVPALVSPWMECGDINKYIKDHQPSCVDILRLFSEIAEGIAHIHERGYAHGDLRGSNILMGPDHHV
ncbi:kinase-like protein [Neolentinus lepideus HHB14362 ss-1]|uniref:Kinase-like protein n=1 Tax=Neolentinus lepideus HHB14362 ss-1 TaxID=1314782 RepID=A0A165MCK0_9AGAM|nr:kinase-like protein [Neolentinus lepideus HHB14362 ss-1]